MGIRLSGGGTDKSDGLDDIAWYRDNSGGKTHPVGQKNPNAWGLYDMRGNVWEWVQGCYGRYEVSGVRNPSGPQSGSYNVFREEAGRMTTGTPFFSALLCPPRRS